MNWISVKERLPSGIWTNELGDIITLFHPIQESYILDAIKEYSRLEDNSYKFAHTIRFCFSDKYARLLLDEYLLKFDNSSFINFICESADKKQIDKDRVFVKFYDRYKEIVWNKIVQTATCDDFILIVIKCKDSKYQDLAWSKFILSAKTDDIKQFLRFKRDIQLYKYVELAKASLSERCLFYNFSFKKLIRFIFN